MCFTLWSYADILNFTTWGCRGACTQGRDFGKTIKATWNQYQTGSSCLWYYLVFRANCKHVGIVSVS